jgi:DNA gyrase subunit A
MSDNFLNSAQNILSVDIKDEVEKDFLEYSMSVIVSRALPDLRDGLKPVQRRILYAMSDLKIIASSPHKKSARIVGEVIGKYHPHGDSSVYEAMVRMSQDFSYRYPLVDGHGNFGSIDGDGAAAMRYTEARLTKLSEYLLKDIDMNTVPFVDNYDATEREPKYLTGYFPNLLANGTTGIAVGMATSIPPHNLKEVCDAIIAYIKDNNLTIEDIMTYIKGPDFPTGALMTGGKEMMNGYLNGKGFVTMRAKISVEENNKKSKIVITEIPYQINKIKTIEKIVDLYKNKVITGITDIRDETNYEGIRIVLELNQAANPQLIINKLYKFTNLQTNFTINMLSLNKDVPEIMNIKTILKNYVRFQVEILIKKTLFEKEKLEKRLHILDAIYIAIENIDEIVQIIKKSKTTEEATNHLFERFGFDKEQSKAILDMRLQRLVNLEQEKIKVEIETIKDRLNELVLILASEEKRNNLLIEQYEFIKNKFGDDRKTKIISVDVAIDDEELIQDKQSVITLSHEGYIRRIDAQIFKTQKRGGKGVIVNQNNEDPIEIVQVGKTKDDVLFFSDKGRIYRAKAYNIPIFSRTARGIPIINIIGVNTAEKITTILSMKQNSQKYKYLFFVTKNGIIKKTEIAEYKLINVQGKVAINLDDDDALVAVIPSTGNDNILIATFNGRISKISETEVRSMSRSSRGVIGIVLKDDDYVTNACSDFGNELVTTLSENGMIKKSEIKEYTLYKRGAVGILSMRLNEKTGKFASLLPIRDTDSIFIVSSLGKAIRFEIDSVKVQSRVSTGVKAFELEDNETVTAAALFWNKQDKGE